jgi:hypothetical protein
VARTAASLSSHRQVGQWSAARLSAARICLSNPRTFSERFESRLERVGRTVIGPRPSSNELARVQIPGATRKQHQRTTNDRSKLGHVVTERAPAISSDDSDAAADLRIAGRLRAMRAGARSAGRARTPRRDPAPQQPPRARSSGSRFRRRRRLRPRGPLPAFEGQESDPFHMCRSNVSQTLVSLDEDDPVRSGERRSPDSGDLRRSPSHVECRGVGCRVWPRSGCSSSRARRIRS